MCGAAMWVVNGVYVCVLAIHWQMDPHTTWRHLLFSARFSGRGRDGANIPDLVFHSTADGTKLLMT